MIRVRFAPSPTGDLHIGNLRIAILNDLFVRKNKGKYILRIDDTDIERNLPDGERRIYEQLKWIGIDWDEGPDKGGHYAPYRQSERIKIYEEIFEDLRRKKLIYPCFCDQKTIDEMKTIQKLRREPPHYDGRCYNLSEDDIRKLSMEKKPVWRFRILDKREVVVNDYFRGKIIFKPIDLGGDFIVRRSNGTFMYNFTTVVDDAMMEITHIIRGEDHLTNTAKQVAIYDALGWSTPEFIHIPLLLDKEGRKLSKRGESLSVPILRQQGYTPEALYFYLGTLGWTKQPSKPLFREDLVKEFELSKLGTSLLKWNKEVLAKLNEKFIRLLEPVQIEKYIKDLISKKSADYLQSIQVEKRTKLLNLLKENATTLKDFENLLRIFYEDTISYGEECINILKEPLPLQECRIEDNILEECLRIASEKGIGKKKLFTFLRCVVTGRKYGPPLSEILLFLDRQLIKKRWTFYWQEVKSGSKF